MAGFAGASDDEMISGINVTPLVDVVLVLLVIFMMTAPVIYQSAIKVQLPKAKTGEQADKSALNFTISKDGSLHWGKDALDWNGLSSKLKSMEGTFGDSTAFISADEATPHGTVIRLMDVLRQSGLTHFALNVDSASSPH